MSQVLSKLSLLPTRDAFVLPGMKVGLDVSRADSVSLIESAINRSPQRLLVAPLRDAAGDFRPSNVPTTAVEAEIVSFQRRGDKLSVVLHGLARVRLRSLTEENGQLVAEAIPVDDPSDPDLLRGMAMALRDQVRQLVAEASGIPTEIRTLVNDQKVSGGELADRLSSYLEFEHHERLALLEEPSAIERMDRVLRRLVSQRTKAEVTAEITAKVNEGLQKTQRELVLRRQLEALEQEMRELDDDKPDDGGDTPAERLEARLAAAQLPEEAQKAADRELRKLAGLNESSPEFTTTTTYLDWLASLPWQKRSADKLDVAEARRILDEDHHGLARIKRRLVEYVALRKVAQNRRAPLLCFVGPPGVGKTSLARSIARALGRELVRLSLGGVRDESEIRGHRRTYVGSQPGRIISSLRRAGTSNPVFLLDEIDKMSADLRGDPEAALLEVLDPEQNSTFTDHYLEVPFDLSQVLFIATANDLQRLSAPLRDRLEIIELPGYTREEKKEIARTHLIPKQLAEHGLGEAAWSITDPALELVLGAYTDEAGVRSLEQKLAALIRAATVGIAEGHAEPTKVTPAQVQLILGPPAREDEDAPPSLEAGHTLGLAWSPTGGSIMHIEATQMPGKAGVELGGLQLTGKLGDVMKESAQASLSYVRSHLAELGIVDPLAGHDVHLHFPEGAIGKDGPSAGVAITAAFVSLASGRHPRPLTAATGEISLRGAVLPVGGIKEKLLAAHRAGVTRIVLPERNRKDLAEVPREVTDKVELIFVSKLGPALDALLEPSSLGAREAA